MIKLHWFTLDKNFGDELSPRLCSHLSGQEITLSRTPCTSDLIAIGSQLEILFGCAENYAGTIWGTGFLSDPRWPVRYPFARIAAVRGHLSRRILGLPDSTPVGDPGLLADLLAPPKLPPKRFTLGLIPHYVDRDSPAVARAAKLDPRITVIDVTAGVDAVIDHVAQCENILASAMHGLILADALAIPNRWLRLSNRVLGGSFKYRDYYSALRIKNPRPARLRPWDTLNSLIKKIPRWSRPALPETRGKLLESFPYRHRGQIPHGLLAG